MIVMDINAFVVFFVCMLGLVKFIMPETKGCTIEEIERSWL